MGPSVSYHKHWMSFLSSHAIMGLILGTTCSPLLGLPFPNAPICGIILGVGLAYYRALLQPCDLSDWQIQLVSSIIHPFNSEHIEPDSYDLHLGSNFARILPNGTKENWSGTSLTIQPNECLLAHTLETFDFPPHIKGHLHGKSSWARLFLFVECAGLFDKGFRGTAVLELYNASSTPLVVQAGAAIAQMSFHRTLPCCTPYGKAPRKSHYQNQKEAEPSCIAAKPLP